MSLWLRAVPTSRPCARTGCGLKEIAEKTLFGRSRSQTIFGDIGTVDFALVCVKSWDVEPVGERIRAIVGPQTAVIPLQNGVDSAQRLIPILGHEPVMGGVAFVTGTIIAPGVIQQTGTHQRITFGELDGRISERGQQLHDLCESAGFEGVLSPNIMVPVWEKFVRLVPFSGLCTLTRLPADTLAKILLALPAGTLAHVLTVLPEPARGALAILPGGGCLTKANDD